MFCKNCGSQMNDNAAFCPNCGWKNTLNEEENKLNGVSNITSKKYFWIAGIAASIIAIVLFVFVIPNFKNDGIENTQSNITVKSDKNLSNGWQGDYYYKNGEKLKNTWVDDYYVGKDGKYLKNTWVGDFYLGKDGKYVKNTWAQYENDWYYCGNDGKVVKNAWVDNQNYYVDASGKMLKNTTTPDGYIVGNDGKYISNKMTGNYNNSIKSNDYTRNKNFEELAAIYNEENYASMSGKMYGLDYRKFDSDGKLWIKELRNNKGTENPSTLTYTIYTTKDDYVTYKWTYYFVMDPIREDDESKYYKNNKKISKDTFLKIENKFNNMVDCYDKLLKNNTNDSKNATTNTKYKNKK